VKTALRDRESVIREAPANLQRGIETVGGKLCLTTARLVFDVTTKDGTEYRLVLFKRAAWRDDIEAQRPAHSRSDVGWFGLP
jgi:hypothetical protein